MSLLRVGANALPAPRYVIFVVALAPLALARTPRISAFSGTHPTSSVGRVRQLGEIALRPADLGILSACSGEQTMGLTSENIGGLDEVVNELLMRRHDSCPSVWRLSGKSPKMRTASR
jgi:hypothetical protein